MADPSVGEALRVMNAAMSLIFVPVVYFVIFRSGHHGNALYRIGMFCVMAGLVNNVILFLGWLPANTETWLLKDLGIYLAVAAIALDFRRGRVPG